MKKGLIVLLVAAIALASFSKKNSSVRSAKITYVKVMEWPQKNAKGKAWDDDSAPDIYMQLVTKGGTPQWTVTVAEGGDSNPGTGGAGKVRSGKKPEAPAASINDETGGRGGNGRLLGAGGKGGFVQVPNDPLDDEVFTNAAGTLTREKFTPYLVDNPNTYISFMDKDQSDSDDFMGAISLNLTEVPKNEAVIFRQQNGFKVEIGLMWEK